MSNSNEKFKVKLSQPTENLNQQEQAETTNESVADQSQNGDFQMTEMDLLYQELVNGMEEVESELNKASEILLEDVDPEEMEQQDSFFDKQDEEKESDKTEEIVLKPNNQSGDLVTPEMIVEALLFVGGQSLTTKKLCHLLGGNADPDSMEKLIDGMNQTYASQNRPYQIQFGEGGFKLVLKGEFGRVQNKVYGLGPKEIKLSQESLEILALIAYQQPISKEQIDKTSRSSASSVVRQLLRRELIEMERSEKNRKNIKYKTTDRFLQVFGMTSLNELPQSEKIDYK